MTEEKKDDVNQAPEAPKAAEAKPVEAAAPAPAAAKEDKAEAAVETKREKPTNCAGCKKSIKNKRWYYRNGKFYCTKRCWGATDKKSNKPQETPAS